MNRRDVLKGLTGGGLTVSAMSMHATAQDDGLTVAFDDGREDVELSGYCVYECKSDCEDAPCSPCAYAKDC